MTSAVAAPAPPSAVLMPRAAQPTAPAGEPSGEMGGLTGTVLDVVEALGALGVGLLTVVETVFPPLPSEVILPLAGYLAERGRMSLAAVLVAATVGAVVGSWVLYGVGARLGRERSALLLSRLPLVDREDVDGAIAWFDRHGPWAVLFGRLVPGVRSLVSLPAGASNMSLTRFTVLTTVGSLAWNAVLVGAGYALGTQWRTVERYAGVVDKVVYAAVVLSVGLFVVRRVRRRRRADVPPQPVRTRDQV
ncbi:DedA family protein [Kineosporia sp. A_224]|uniref:DedA family protein n=1 Tax=Kineosporia sp. A_224 TaxID=1962180 RepID=UPI001E2FD86D|nr:DedA family protein [Kineosporia sp. A_224]